MLRLARSLNRYAGASSCSTLRSRRSYTSESRPWIASSSMKLFDGRYMDFNMPGAAKKTETESDETLCFFANMPGVKKEDVKACVEKTITGAYVYIEGTKKKYYDEPKVVYRAYICLPAATNLDMINTEMLQDGMVEVTMPKPKRKPKSKHYNFFNKIFVILIYKFYLRFCYTMPTVIMTIARRSVINLYCANPWESITMYKEKTGKTVHISVTPGLHKKDACVGGVCISLNMPELRGIEDVKSFFKYDTLFIQGKTTTKNKVKVSYFTGIRLPEGYTRKNCMIKEEMLQGGMYKATIPSLVTYC